MTPGTRFLLCLSFIGFALLGEAAMALIEMTAQMEVMR